MGNVRVLIVAGDPLARSGLATILAGQPGQTVVGQVGLEADLSAALDLHQPDVVVLDLGWEPTLHLERVGDLKEFSQPFIALLPDETHASEVWGAGPLGLLLRDTDGESLQAAVAAVAKGVVVLHSSIASALVRARGQGPIPPAVELTPRELEVLRLLAEGLPNKAIAHRLDISEHTVKFHVNSILGKLGAQSRTEAVINATRLGLILI